MRNDLINLVVLIIVVIVGIFMGIVGLLVIEHHSVFQHPSTINVTVSPVPKVDGWTCGNYVTIASEINSLYDFGSSPDETDKIVMSTVTTDQLPLAIAMKTAVYSQKTKGTSRPVLDLLLKVCL